MLCEAESTGSYPGAGPDKLRVGSAVICEFRSRLVTSNVEQLILSVMLRLCVERKRLKTRDKQRTDSTYVLTSIRTPIRL